MCYRFIAVYNTLGTEMKISYIRHSSFSIEFEHAVFLFDFYEGNLPQFNREKEIYVFASHKHGDHFSLKVFDLLNEYPHIKFILAEDISRSAPYLEKKEIQRNLKESIITVGSHMRIQVDGLRIETLKSTDEGVAFVIDYGKYSVYHAGDLNWWHWEGESVRFNTQMEEDYKQEINRLKGRYFDAAFVPLDPRLGNYFAFGINYFMKHTDTQNVIPMHFWKDYSVMDKLLHNKEAAFFKDRFLCISDENQNWEI